VRRQGTRDEGQGHHDAGDEEIRDDDEAAPSQLARAEERYALDRAAGLLGDLSESVFPWPGQRLIERRPQ